MENRWVISRRMTGLGDRIISLAAAWRYARITGRALMVDWRFSYYTTHWSENAFALFFEPTSELGGVPFYCNREEIFQLEFPQPRYPTVWNDDDLLAFPVVGGNVFECPFGRDEAVALICSGQDIDAGTVVFDQCVNDGLVEFAEASAFLRSLRPIAQARDEVARFRREMLGSEPFIGLHVRHGNGGDIMGHASSWVDFELAVSRCTAAVSAARAKLGASARVLLCTDSVEVEQVLCMRLANVVCRPKAHRARGAGELHWTPTAYEGRFDALVEMLLLAESHALIRYPAGSFFSLWAAVLKPRREPAPATVYELLRPWDATDPLAPAILL